MMLVLSLFPGLDLLGKAFEEYGFCVVRGPDKLWGGDIRAFHPPAGVFKGVIAGSPCQGFSHLNRAGDDGYSLEMLMQFERVVAACQPDWFLLENVSQVPNVSTPGYIVQRIDVNQAWYSEYSRLRHIQFGSKDGLYLDIPRGKRSAKALGVYAGDNRSFAEMCHIQGLEEGFDLPFTLAEKKRAIANGVPLCVGRVLASAVLAVTTRRETGVTPRSRSSVTNQAIQDVTWPGSQTVTSRQMQGVTELSQQSVTPLLVESVTQMAQKHVARCGCGCGRPLTGRKSYYDASCRKRAQRQRQKGEAVDYEREV